MKRTMTNKRLGEIKKLLTKETKRNWIIGKDRRSFSSTSNGITILCIFEDDNPITLSLIDGGSLEYQFKTSILNYPGEDVYIGIQNVYGLYYVCKGLFST